MQTEKKKILVLGSGLVGGVMAMDLAKNNEFDVTAADIDESKFKKFEKFPNIKTVKADLTNPSII